LPACSKHSVYFRACCSVFNANYGDILMSLDNPKTLLRRLRFAILFAAILAIMGQAGSSLAEVKCTGACQDMGNNLLSGFGKLLSSSEGQALLEANLKTEEHIYINSTQSRKIIAAEDALITYVPQNILIHAFPTNPNFFHSAAGIPVTAGLPDHVTNAVQSIAFTNIPLPLQEYLGLTFNIYGKAYIPKNLMINKQGDPRPFQVSTAIKSNPFTEVNSSLLARQIQQDGVIIGADRSPENWTKLTGVAAFPSGHSTYGNTTALFYAILMPGYYQQLAQAGLDFNYSRNVFGVHYPLDTIGGRISAMYIIAEMLAGNPLYSRQSFTMADIPLLSQTMQNYLGGGSSPYAALCAGKVATYSVIPSAADYARARQNYTDLLTYGLPSVGDTTLPPIVPSNAWRLIATRFPYLNTAQLNEVLATTELSSGVPLDNGTGWVRLNLYAAAGGYGILRKNVAVNMNGALGGLNAFDIWSNNISGPGSLTKQGSGTLILAGSNSYTGGTDVRGGTLVITGTLGGKLVISPGATVINTGRIEGDVNNSGSFTNHGVVTGHVSTLNTGPLSPQPSFGRIPGTFIFSTSRSFCKE